MDTLDIEGLVDAYNDAVKPRGMNRVRKWLYSNTQWIRNIKYCHQRIKKGYCDMDVWDIDKWFYKVAVPMIDEHRRKFDSIPNKISEKHIDGEGNLDEKAAVEEWDRELRKMIWLFRESDKETSIKGSNLGKEYMDKCKKCAFSMFSYYFHDLWN